MQNANQHMALAYFMAQNRNSIPIDLTSWSMFLNAQAQSSEINVAFPAFAA
jgi:hypothetical protein